MHSYEHSFYVSFMRTALYIPIFILSLENARIFNNFARDSLGSFHVPWKICPQRISMPNGGQFTLSTHFCPINLVPSVSHLSALTERSGEIYLAPGGGKMRVLGTRLLPKINHKTAGRKIILKKKIRNFVLYRALQSFS